MKVLLINNFHYRKGGSETVYFNTGRLLEQMGHKVIWFSFSDPKNADCEQSEFFPKRTKSVKDYFYNRSVAERLDALLEAEKPDIAHVHLIWGGVGPAIFEPLKRHGVPLVHSVHDYRMVCPAYTLRDGSGHICERCRGGNYFQCFHHRCAKSSLLRSLVSAMEIRSRDKKYNPLVNIDGFVFVSSFCRDQHIRMNHAFAKAQSIVLHNCSPERPAAQGRGAYMLYYGRLSAEKGVKTLIAAVSQRPDMALKIVGTGPLEKKLRSKAAPNIEFLGFKTGEELFSIVAGSSFVVVPSQWYENNPMTVIEPYSMGRPVIGAAIGGIPEIVLPLETGFLFESGSVPALLSTLDRATALSDEKYAQMCNAARDYYLREFSEQSHINTLIDFYNQVISNYRNEGK